VENPRGTLWKGELEGVPVALFECELPQPVRRGVLLAVDSTDSCWPADCTDEGDTLHPEVDALLSALSEVLEPGDECSIWLFGRTEPTLRTTIAPGVHPGEITGSLRRGISPVLGGTWLQHTLRAMIREADTQRSLGMAPFVLVATDGEIFDWEALRELLPGLGAALVELRANDPVAPEPLQDLTVTVPPTRGSLRSFMALPERQIHLSVPGWEGRAVTRFSGAGELEPGPALSVPNGASWLRVAFVGGTPPRPVLIFKQGADESRVADFEVRAVDARIPRHLGRVLDLLRADCWSWDAERLRRLASKLDTGRNEESNAIACRHESCPAHRKGVPLEQLRRSLFCPSCQNLLLAERSITRSQLERRGGPLVWQIPLDPTGRPGEPTAVSSRAGDRDVCRILDDQDGRRLEIHLISRDYV
jgi:hypothetical protein